MPPTSRKGPSKKAAKAPAKNSAAKPAAKKAPARKAAPPAAPVPSAPAAEPEFVRRASFAERKAALEALAEAEGVKAIATPPAAPAAPAPLPPFVKESSPAERKAAMEKVVEETGVAGVLAKAPWKRSASAAVPAVPAAPPTPAPPAAERGAPKLQMTKAPLASETGRSAPRTVILDTNALMMQFQFHVDIEREVRRILNINFDIVVPDLVVRELERLAKEGNAKEAAEARMARELAKTFQIVETTGDGDTGILRLAEKLNSVVVTNDKVLRARLRAKDIPNIYMRSRAFLTLEGHLPGL